MKYQKLFAFTLAICMLTGIGCDSSESLKPTDEQNAFASVAGLGDLAGDEESFANAFVSGSVPENRKDYSERGYEVAGEATFDGDTVTVPVKIFGGVHATGSGEKRNAKASTASETEKTWTLIRVDDKWKIKDAPLS